MNEFLENLKRQAEENPVVALGVAATLIASIGQLVKANAAMKNSKSWKRETRRREMKDARKR